MSTGSDHGSSTIISRRGVPYGAAFACADYKVQDRTPPAGGARTARNLNNKRLLGKRFRAVWPVQPVCAIIAMPYQVLL